MPYELSEDGKCVRKMGGETLECYDNHEDALSYLRALEVNVKDSAFQELSLFISRASFETNEPDPDKRMRFRMSSSDIDKDLSEESMSLELFESFVSRIKNNTPIPEPFKSAICEGEWCGGMPYLSVAHYKSGPNGKNVPGVIEDVYVDGHILKSKGYCKENPLGRAVFNSLLDDQQKRKSGVSDFDPVRVSIGFLDLKHKHQLQDGAGEFIFERKSLADFCPLCEKGIGGKIYLDGVLVHEAMTRVPMNPRTIMIAEDGMTEKSAADEIRTKLDDARSVIGDLADGLEDNLETKSILTVKADGTATENVPDPSKYDECYDPNTGGYDQDCIDRKVAGDMAGVRNQMDTVKSAVDKNLLDGVYASLKTIYKSNGLEMPVEAIMETEVVVEKTQDEDADDKGKKKEMMHEEEMKSALDLAQENLKSVLASGKATREQVQEAFNAVAVEVEKSYTPPAPDMSNLAEIVKSAVEDAIAPIRMELATLKAAKTDSVSTNKSGVPAPRSLKLTPEILTQRTQAPVRKLSQIEKLARKSTGLPVEE